MNLCTLAYPVLKPADYERIQGFRKQNDRYFPVVEPHFTLIFPTPEWELEPYRAEIIKQISGIQPFDFCLRCAVLNKDAFQDLYHTFLVPDEGFSQFVKLHYTLCADRFFDPQSLEVDFIPHVGVGNTKDPLKCYEMVVNWNCEDFAISGHISALDIGNYENDTVETIERIFLG
jgi:hypothetical protein